MGETKRDMLGKEFIQALNDFEKKGRVNIRTSGAPMAHPSIIVDRSDDNIVIVSPTTMHMSHNQIVWLDKKLNAAGKYSWMMIEKYVSIINHPSISKQVHELDPAQSRKFLFELFNRMMVIIDEGEYNTDNVREAFQAMYNAFGSDKDLDNMLLEVISDILSDVPTSCNMCRTCKHCSTIGDTPGYGKCGVCTFVPNEERVTISEFRSEFGKHIFTKGGVIYTDITTGVDYCEDYVKRPINVSSALASWLLS